MYVFFIYYPWTPLCIIAFNSLIYVINPILNRYLTVDIKCLTSANIYSPGKIGIKFLLALFTSESVYRSKKINQNKSTSRFSVKSKIEEWKRVLLGSSANGGGSTTAPTVPERPLSTLSQRPGNEVTLPDHGAMKRQPSVNKISSRKSPFYFVCTLLHSCT